ncbi:T9SS type A sorting domain-containing protein [Kaistella flava (ex Peng et al. 2021)]|uniref:T9SS type A sorting domain-containing protein n=1 Tax=Kaistella flava (ex Peng et al. 2021) TaxID=2038776 RepID=A0A7M2Y4P4_9FLAO|nr:T9SS type A sorting domain-containing protein [Kaistella flava (ex Peng et al. 2021)]QOW09208.1 T9SS type A sorting domain-containing protein [Kaistella flava (ex Peng et al. 2021)]
MKKLLCSVLVVGSFIFATAQTKIALHDQPTSSVQKKKSLKDYKRNHDLNRAQLFTGTISGKGGAVPANVTSKSVTPSASIYTQLWGEVKSVSQEEKQLFLINYNYGVDAKVTVRLLDDQINVTKSFTVALPESANNFGMLNEYYYDADGKRNFMIYVHHFVGNGGPENQRDSVFIVTETGEIVATLDGFGAKVVETSTGRKIMTFHDEEDQMLISNYNIADFSLDKSMAIPFDLLNFMSGSPANFMNVKGVPSMVLAHYEKLFMDNDTFEVFPDNHLIVGIYDFDLNLKKSIALDISSAYPEEPYTIPMAEFGMFYGYGKYDVTDKTFNDDEAIEVLYSVYYFDLLGDREWNHYFVGDENGNRIRSLEKDIIGRVELQELPGHDDQIGLFIGDDEMVGGLNMFNMKSWTSAYEFPAYYNGELLSLNFNRMPVGDSYDYLFGMPDLDVVGAQSFGKINHYDSQGQFKKATKLSLGENVMNFTPLLYDQAMTPNLYLNDNQPTYTYVSKHLAGGKAYNILRVAKNETEIIFEAQGDNTKGDLVGSSYITDSNDNIKKLALLYTTGNYNMTIDFHDLPFTALNTQSTSLKNSLLVYVDKTSNTVRWNETSNSYAVYSMSGSLIRQGGKGESFSTAGLPKGVYVLMITTPKGEKLTKRFIL